MGKKKNTKFIVGFFMTVMCFAMFNVSVKAESLTNSTTKSYLFAVAEGGWSSINMKVMYSENYTKSGNYNKFTSRSKSVLCTRAYATSCPEVYILNVKHSNDKTFSDWTIGSMIFDSSKWNEGFYYTNSSSVKYINTTNVTGNLPFEVYCSGATPTYNMGSVSLSLNTK
ncbi:hypothetical protein C8E03_110125 [Lachnotalea glycerini]|uniref:Uncharacterized protein n=1 Tax=Lachnotalea glycerini TaxID=1763509 RepID=A0A318ETM6_9FIRM|nr:hypothetical protein [Lachnotalea glycerini]PXV87364.1 hypothetical protein C8E03_110125 [Lachnotalea glycerini]